MNEQERSELELLRNRQAWLQRELSELDRRFQAFEARVARPQPSRPLPTQEYQTVHVPLAQQPPPIPPVISRASAPPPPVEPIIIPAVTSNPPPPELQAVDSPPPLATASGPFTNATAAAPEKERSFEMRLGTFWLVRIGIVMLLTGLVFFGNYAYQNFISKIGAAGKVGLLYLASIGLLVSGWWLQRKVMKETVKNYGQVLFAGGLAAFYFTTYAAHHFEHLRVIQSAGWDGFLLLLWAGFMVRIADRKKSEVLALFAVLLAYYTGIISRDAGLFTLYSNLVLTIAAVFFLVRNRWAALSFVSLGATYAAYGFWRFLHNTDWQWAYPEQGLWTGIYFLVSYWAVFTAAVFLSRDEKFAGPNRASFITANNGAFFALFLLTMLQTHQGGFWKFSSVYGIILLGLAGLAKKLLAQEPLAENTYLTQGLLLFTTGIVCHPKLAGLNLALVLAVESVTLLMTGLLRKNLVLIVAAYTAAALGLGWGMDGMLQHEPHGMWLGMALGALMLANALVTHREYGGAAATKLRPQVGYFVVLALAIWFVVTYNNTARSSFPIVMAVEGLLLTVSIYLLGVRELSLFAQAFLVIAHVSWLAFYAVEIRPPLPAWHRPASLIAITLAVSHWWQRQKTLSVPRQLALLWQGVYALAVVGVGYYWLSERASPAHWLALSAMLALALTAYGTVTRAWMIAAFGQLFLVVSLAQFGLQLTQGKPEWIFPLTPITVLAFLSLATIKWFRQRSASAAPIREPLLQVALLYRWVALVMSLWWVIKYIPERQRIWIFTLLGCVMFFLAGLRRDREALLFAGTFMAAGILLFLFAWQESSTVLIPNLLSILILLALQRIAKRFPDRFLIDNRAQAGMIVVGGLTLWLFVSRGIDEHLSASYLTASWSVVALILFGFGIATRERVYRWLGLGILACTIGRVVVVDVWKLEMIYRVFSFMALGAVLLVLGFIYSKYQEKIREWL